MAAEQPEQPTEVDATTLQGFIGEAGDLSASPGGMDVDTGTAEEFQLTPKTAGTVTFNAGAVASPTSPVDSPVDEDGNEDKATATNTKETLRRRLNTAGDAAGRSSQGDVTVTASLEEINNLEAMIADEEARQEAMDIRIAEDKKRHNEEIDLKAAAAKKDLLLTKLADLKSKNELSFGKIGVKTEPSSSAFSHPVAQPPPAAARADTAAAIKEQLGRQQQPLQQQQQQQPPVAGSIYTDALRRITELEGTSQRHAADINVLQRCHESVWTRVCGLTTITSEMAATEASSALEVIPKGKGKGKGKQGAKGHLRNVVIPTIEERLMFWNSSEPASFHASIQAWQTTSRGMRIRVKDSTKRLEVKSSLERLMASATLPLEVKYADSSAGLSLSRVSQVVFGITRDSVGGLALFRAGGRNENEMNFSLSEGTEAGGAVLVSGTFDALDCTVVVAAAADASYGLVHKLKDRLAELGANGKLMHICHVRIEGGRYGLARVERKGKGKEKGNLDGKGKGDGGGKGGQFRASQGPPPFAAAPAAAAPTRLPFAFGSAQPGAPTGTMADPWIPYAGPAQR